MGRHRFNSFPGQTESTKVQTQSALGRYPADAVTTSLEARLSFCFLNVYQRSLCGWVRSPRTRRSACQSDEEQSLFSAFLVRVKSNATSGFRTCFSEIYGTWNNISDTVVFAKEVGTVLLFFIDILNSKNLQKPKGKLAGLCTSRQALQRKWRRSASMCPRKDPFQFLSRLQISQIKKFRSRAERDVM